MSVNVVPQFLLTFQSLSCSWTDEPIYKLLWTCAQAILYRAVSTCLHEDPLLRSNLGSKTQVRFSSTTEIFFQSLVPGTSKWAVEAQALLHQRSLNSEIKFPWMELHTRSQILTLLARGISKFSYSFLILFPPSAPQMRWKSQHVEFLLPSC